MKFMPLLVAALLAGGAAASALADDLARWKTYPLASHGDLAVNLRVQPEATLADEDWIAIEFIQRGEAPIRVKEAYYSIEASFYDLPSGELVGRGRLASGNSESLFPDAWKTAPVRPAVLRPGTYRLVEQPSSYSSALLGLAPPRGQRVRASIKLELVLGDGTKLATAEPTPFEFAWLRPDAAGFERMQDRLKHLVAHPKFRDEHFYLLGALLRIDDVSRALTLAEALAGLEKFGSLITGRDRLAIFLDRRFSEDPALLASLEARLRRQDQAVLHELALMPATWDDRLLEPLLKMFEADAAHWPLVIMVLELHGSPHKTNPALARRLSRAIVASGALRDDSANAAAARWHALRMLGQTHDRGAVQHLRPLLDDLRPAPVDSVAPKFLKKMPPFRIGDVALEAALLLLDGDASSMYPAVQHEELDWNAVIEQTNRMRDALIAQVKRRIDDR